MDYKQLQKRCEDIYTSNYSKVSKNLQEKSPSQPPLKCCYSCAKCFIFKSVTPTTMEKDRNECTTTQTIIDFFTNAFTKVGVRTKVLVPPKEIRVTHVNDFSENLHITNMVIINCAGDVSSIFNTAIGVSPKERFTNGYEKSNHFRNEQFGLMTWLKN